MRVNNALEPTAPFPARGSLFFAVFPSLQAARQTPGFHPAQWLAAQRRVLRTDCEGQTFAKLQAGFIVMKQNRRACMGSAHAGAGLLQQRALAPWEIGEGAITLHSLSHLWPFCYELSMVAPRPSSFYGMRVGNTYRIAVFFKNLMFFTRPFGGK